MSAPDRPRDRARRLTAEFLGTAALLTAVVGSGIMGDRLSGGNVAIALLANTLATTATLMVLIFVFAPISGAHFNPAVTLSMAARGRAARRDVLPYLVAQIVGGFAGVAVAHLMFGEPAFALSTQARSGAAQGFSEFIATFGLLAVIWGVGRLPAAVAPVCIAAYIAGAYWFTASTSFANPAVTLARTLTDTFAGIRPMDAPAFIVAQIIGALAATALFAWLIPDTEDA